MSAVLVCEQLIMMLVVYWPRSEEPAQFAKKVMLYNHNNRELT